MVSENGFARKQKRVWWEKTDLHGNGNGYGGYGGYDGSRLVMEAFAIVTNIKSAQLN